MRCKTQKAPPKRGQKIFSKNAKGLLCGLPRSRRLLAMTFFSLTAPQGERSDRACTGVAEPKGSYTVGVESTVYRGMLSDQLNIDSMTITKVLIHCISWDSFGEINSIIDTIA